MGIKLERCENVQSVNVSPDFSAAATDESVRQKKRFWRKVSSGS